MRGISLIFVVVSKSAVAVASVGCVDTGRVPPPPGPPECSVTREQALQVILPGCISFVFDEDTGGPLTCVPGTGDACRDVDEDCVAGPIEVPVGRETTLPVGLRDVCPTAIGVRLTARFTDDSDPAFSLLEPSADIGFVEEGQLFLSVTPAVAGTVAARVLVSTDARNVVDDDEFDDFTSFGVVVEAVDVGDE